ncbi:M23 family metallopeptidase [Christiangramia sp. SM2212]|uniref:M23 family metallopeptidase n=1 Tax=Christiangramia sediminicola TaxID=3073267 RepID=A0ABU1EPE3_9FLAO|nr:M23 family metallopeptidase [Christiangramia sp. SM2212]MDR5590257.1 M23 family metallopeptidase [Christiangramia sp. SM2212]
MKILDIHEFREGDRHGFGHFGASRSGGTRTHKGVDLVANPGDYVYAPFKGKITKYGYCYGDTLEYRYIEITGDKHICRILYSELDDAFDVGDSVPEDQFIGIAQAIEKRYPGITPHVHVEIYKVSDTSRKSPLDPTELLKKKDLFTEL